MHVYGDIIVLKILLIVIFEILKIDNIISLNKAISEKNKKGISKALTFLWQNVYRNIL